MEYAVDMGSVVTIHVYIPRFINIFRLSERQVSKEGFTDTKSIGTHKPNFIF
jgi:hypothetical protein